MRILLLNTSFPPQLRSAARLFHDLARDLVRRGHEVNVVTEMPWRRLGTACDAATIPKRELMDGVQVVRVTGYSFGEASLVGRGINLLGLPHAFYAAARSLGQHDVVLVYSPPLTLGITAWMLQKWHDTPFIFNVQDIYPQTAMDLGALKNRPLIAAFETLEQFIYRSAMCVVVHSEGNREFLVRRGRVHCDKVVAIPNWIDTDTIQPSGRMNSFREKHGIGDRFLVCYAGTMGYAQDLTAIIDAAAALQSQEDILFLFVGEGIRRKEFEHKAARLKNVRFLPLQPAAEYLDLIAASDVGLVPLTGDLRTPVVPGKLLDFMAGARPVIAPVNLEGDTSRIIAAAQCGYALAPRDASAVRDAVHGLYANPSHARFLGRNGRKYAESHFSLRVCAEAYERLFDEVIGAAELRRPVAAGSARTSEGPLTG